LPRPRDKIVIEERIMPLYEYACRSCAAEFEALVRGQEKPQCPQCESRDLQKLLSATAVHSAGSHELPTCRPAPAGGCGLPQCGMGGCQL
jgi:putative FmdB family regulatory protein